MHVILSWNCSGVVVKSAAFCVELRWLRGAHGRQSAWYPDWLWTLKDSCYTTSGRIHFILWIGNFVVVFSYDEPAAVSWRLHIYVNLNVKFFPIHWKRRCVAFYWKLISELWSITCHMGSHIITCHLTQVNVLYLNPSQIVWYLIFLPQRDGRLSCLRCLVTCRDGLPARRQSPMQVPTRPSVEQLLWSTQRVTATPCHQPI